MKNILSFKRNSIFTGAEIKDWIKFNLENSDNNKRKIANRLKRFLTIHDEVSYFITLAPKNAESVNRYCPCIHKAS